MTLARRFWQEETGAETVEYALVLGFMALAAVVGLTAAGSAVSQWWNNLATYIGTVNSA